MVKGYVDKNLQVIAEIGLLNRRKSMPIKAIVDTGFMGNSSFITFQEIHCTSSLGMIMQHLSAFVFCY